MSEKKIDLVHRIEFTIAEHGVTSYWIAALKDVGYGEDMDKWVNAYYVRELLGEAKEFERIFSQYMCLDRDGDGSITSEECMEMIMHRFGRWGLHAFAYIWCDII